MVNTVMPSTPLTAARVAESTRATPRQAAVSRACDSVGDGSRPPGLLPRGPAVSPRCSRRHRPPPARGDAAPRGRLGKGSGHRRDRGGGPSAVRAGHRRPGCRGRAPIPPTPRWGSRCRGRSPVSRPRRRSGGGEGTPRSPPAGRHHLGEDGERYLLRVAAPRSSPTGLWICETASALRPSCCRRVTRFAWVLRLPIAPT